MIYSPWLIKKIEGSEFKRREEEWKGQNVEGLGQ